MMMQLAQTFGAQMQLLPVGLAGPNELHATVVEMSKLAGFANPDKFWVDPTNKPLPPQAPPPEIQKEQMKIQADSEKFKATAQLDQQKFQAETALEQQRMQQQAALDQNREEMQARQKQLELQQQAEIQRMNAAYQAQQAERELEFKRWQAELQAMVTLQVAGMKDKPDLSEQDSKIGELMESLQEMAEELNAPAELVRDESGKAVAVRKGNRTRKVVRGPDGRAIGVQ